MAMMLLFASSSRRQDDVPCRSYVRSSSVDRSTILSNSGALQGPTRALRTAHNGSDARFSRQLPQKAIKLTGFGTVELQSSLGDRVSRSRWPAAI